MSHFSALHLQVISSLQGQETGLRDHGELIKVHVVPYNTLWRSSPDAKALAAIALYEMALKLNLLPLPPNAPELSALWPISVMHMDRFQGEMVIQVG